MKQVLEIIGSNQRTGSTQDRRYGYQPRLWATSSFWLPGYMGHHSRGSLEWSTDGISLDPKGGPVSAHARAFTPTHDIEHDASVQGSVQGSDKPGTRSFTHTLRAQHLASGRLQH